MSKLTLTATGFINKVTTLDSGKIAIDLALNSYSVKKGDDDYETKRLYVTAYTNDEKRIPQDFDKKPFEVTLHGLMANPQVSKDGKAFANLTASFESATPITKD